MVYEIILTIFRFIAGVGIGITLSVVAMYLGEIAEDSTRGALCTLINQTMNVSILLTYCIGPWISRLALASFGGFLSVLFALMFIWMPDSPYFLLMKQRTDEAEKSLSWLRGRTDVKEELNNIQKNIDSDVTESGTVKDLFMTSGNRKVRIHCLSCVIYSDFEIFNSFYHTPGRRNHDWFGTDTTI